MEIIEEDGKRYVYEKKEIKSLIDDTNTICRNDYVEYDGNIYIFKKYMRETVKLKGLDGKQYEFPWF